LLFGTLSLTKSWDFIIVNIADYSILNKILAVDLYADIFVPGFDNSAMDGYAINLKAEQINIPGGTTFKINRK
jgi:molybdopterin molybdotransferase